MVKNVINSVTDVTPLAHILFFFYLLLASLYSSVCQMYLLKSFFFGASPSFLPFSCLKLPFREGFDCTCHCSCSMLMIMDIFKWFNSVLNNEQKCWTQKLSL